MQVKEHFDDVIFKPKLFIADRISQRNQAKWGDLWRDAADRFVEQLSDERKETIKILMSAELATWAKEAGNSNKAIEILILNLAAFFLYGVAVNKFAKVEQKEFYPFRDEEFADTGLAPPFLKIEDGAKLLEIGESELLELESSSKNYMMEREEYYQPIRNRFFRVIDWLRPELHAKAVTCAYLNESSEIVTIEEEIWGGIHARQFLAEGKYESYDILIADTVIKLASKEGRNWRIPLADANISKARIKPMGRPIGSGTFERSDQVLLEKMRQAIEADKDLSVNAAAKKFADEAKGASFDSKVRRLTRRYKKVRQ